MYLVSENAFQFMSLISYDIDVLQSVIVLCIHDTQVTSRMLSHGNREYQRIVQQ